MEEAEGERERRRRRTKKKKKKKDEEEKGEEEEEEGYITSHAHKKTLKKRPRRGRDTFLFLFTTLDRIFYLFYYYDIPSHFLVKISIFSLVMSVCDISSSSFVYSPCCFHEMNTSNPLNGFQDRDWLALCNLFFTLIIHQLEPTTRLFFFYYFPWLKQVLTLKAVLFDSAILLASEINRVRDVIGALFILSLTMAHKFQLSTTARGEGDRYDWLAMVYNASLTIPHHFSLAYRFQYLDFHSALDYWFVFGLTRIQGLRYLSCSHFFLGRRHSSTTFVSN